MSGGEINPAECIAYTVSSAVEYAGLIVTKSASQDYMDLASNASTQIPAGYTYTSSKNPITGVAEANKKVGIHALIPGQIAEFVLPDTHAAVAVGDKLTFTTGGRVIKCTSGPAWVVGIAEKSVSQNTGGFIKARIMVYYLAA